MTGIVMEQSSSTPHRSLFPSSGMFANAVSSDQTNLFANTLQLEIFCCSFIWYIPETREKRVLICSM
ncbi:hypothetical protein EI42_03114 [Thermosporothrix hazakensis]|jgi:hypothetical protein|uniref:Uncharacterized protein n=1 Tax=Thermosporothrix hazakensis TaxID=644383 RepID=A0A326U6C8_THEHA|nr:hypothetical protein EI42_03114 [Thermosporothrix hazakensis]